MHAFTARTFSCALGLALSVLILEIAIPIWSFILCAALITFFYVFLKPLAQLIALPFNLLLMNIAQVFADALLVWWASAWTPGFTLTYLQAALTATLIGVCFFPYDIAKRKKLLG